MRISDGSVSSDGSTNGQAAAAVFGAFFAIIGGFHVALLLSSKTYFFYLAPLSAFFQSIGFALQCALNALIDPSFDSDGETIYALFFTTSFLYLFASSFLSIAVYQVLGRLVWLLCPTSKRSFDNLKLPPHHITNLAIFVEVFSNIFIVASNLLMAVALSDGWYSSSEEGYAAMHALAVTGTALQLCGRLYLLLATLRIMEDSKSWPIQKSVTLKYGHKEMLQVLTVAGLLQITRTLYSLVIIADNKPVAEWTFYVFDASLMFLVLTALAALHPRRGLPQSFAQLRLDKKALPQPPFSDAAPPMQVEEGIEYLPVYTAELHSEARPNELPNRMSRAELSAQRRSNTEI